MLVVSTICFEVVRIAAIPVYIVNLANVDLFDIENLFTNTVSVFVERINIMITCGKQN